MFFRIHREGFTILIVAAIILAVLTLTVRYFLPVACLPVLLLSVIFYLLILQFFRNPIRKIITSDNHLVYAPADGKVVVIEETLEPEYFHDRRLQVSIFMSPLNVHVNRNPIGGIVQYFKYHAGKYLVAWNPKSSTENERTTTVIKSGDKEILLRQIAGAVAKRIVNYLHQGEQVKQGEDMGFIKFGSRVDLFLPLDAKIEVKINQKVKGNLSVIARL